MTGRLDDCANADDAAAAREATRVRLRQVSRTFWITLALNTFVALSKAAYGFVSGSLTLGTDALHSILDASSNVLALLGVRRRRRLLVDRAG